MEKAIFPHFEHHLKVSGSNLPGQQRLFCGSLVLPVPAWVLSGSPKTCIRGSRRTSDHQDVVRVERDGGQQPFSLKHGGLIGLNSVILPVCSDVCLQMMCLFRRPEPRDAMALRPD